MGTYSCSCRVNFFQIFTATTFDALSVEEIVVVRRYCVSQQDLDSSKSLFLDLELLHVKLPHLIRYDISPTGLGIIQVLPTFSFHQNTKDQNHTKISPY